MESVSFYWGNLQLSFGALYLKIILTDVAIKNLIMNKKFFGTAKKCCQNEIELKVFLKLFLIWDTVAVAYG